MIDTVEREVQDRLDKLESGFTKLTSRMPKANMIAKAVDGHHHMESVELFDESVSQGFGYQIDFQGASVYSYRDGRRHIVKMDTTMSFAQGTYVGDGAASKAITGLGFRPKLVVVKGDTATNGHAMVRATSMSAAENLTNGTQDQGIASLDADGFTVNLTASVNGRTNVLGATYYWYAFGGDLVISGSYTGNGVSGRQVTGLAVTPVMLWVIRPLGGPHCYRTSTMTATDLDFANSAGETDRIKSLDNAGFTLGADSQVNTAAVTYHYIAFGRASNLGFGTYIGNSVDNRNLPDAVAGSTPTTAFAFDPTMVSIVSEASQLAVWKVSSLAGDAALNYSSTASAANKIQSFGTGQFQVGTSAEANFLNAVYHYFVVTAATPNSRITVREDGVLVSNSVGTLNFTEPDVTLLSLSGSTVTANMALYTLLGGRNNSLLSGSTGQDIFGTRGSSGELGLWPAAADNIYTGFTIRSISPTAGGVIGRVRLQDSFATGIMTSPGATLTFIDILNSLGTVIGANNTTITGWSTEGLAGFTNTGKTGTIFRSIYSSGNISGGTVTSWATFEGVIQPSGTPTTITTAYGLKVSGDYASLGTPGAGSTDVKGVHIGDVGHANFANVTALDILSQTAGGTLTFNIRQRGITGVNRLAAPTLIGQDASPTFAIFEVSGGTVSPTAASNARLALVSGTIVEAGSGLHARLVGLELTAPTITAGAATVTATATLYISGAPSATTTTANQNYGMMVGGTRAIQFLTTSAELRDLNHARVARISATGPGLDLIPRIGINQANSATVRFSLTENAALSGTQILNRYTLASTQSGNTTSLAVFQADGTHNIDDGVAEYNLTTFKAFLVNTSLSSNTGFGTGIVTDFWGFDLAATSALGAGTQHVNVYGLEIRALPTGSTLNIAIRQGQTGHHNRLAGGLMVGQDATPIAMCHIYQPTLANEVQRLESTATNDDPRESVYQNRVATTDATVTTLHTVTIPASTTVQINAWVTARRTGGAAGTAEDGAGYMVQATVKNVAGTATLIGAVNQICVQEDQAGWDATIDVTAATARVRVTGAANNNITWHATVRTWQLST